MIGAVLPLLVAVPLLTAGLLTVVPHGRVHAVVMLTVLVASPAGGIGLVMHFGSGGAIAHGVGSWPVGIAIALAADMFSALMLTVTGLLAVTCASFALLAGGASSRFFAPLMLVLLAGVNGALLTADLFNLFVFIEVMLLGSYGLFVLTTVRRAPLRQVAGARLYVTLNLLTSTIFLIGVGFVYGTAGTVSLAELFATARHDNTVALAVGICLFALAIKAAVVPVHGWLARAYPATSPAITALFSGLHTKVAIYGIYRIYAVVFDGDARWLWAGVLVFVATMVLGVLGAVGEHTTRSILAFHMVSQIGYILLGVALFTLAGLTAGIFYLLHHMIVKASLFLSTGAIEVRHGTGRLGMLWEVARREPLIAAVFFVAALSLAGLPPFSGFVAKFHLIVAALAAGHPVAVVVMLLVSLVTLLSMLKIWSGIFWGERRAVEPTDDAVPSGDGPLRAGPSGVNTSDRSTILTAAPPRVGVLAVPGLVLALGTIGLGLGAELLLSLSETAAHGLLDPSAYVRAVTGS